MPGSLKPLLQVLACGGASLAVWYAELAWITGWEGIRWVWVFPWSSLAVCVLVGCSALVVLRRGSHWPLHRSVGLVAAVAAPSLGAFLLARWGIQEGESIHPALWDELMMTRSILPQVAALALAVAGIHLAARALGPARASSLLRLALAILLVFPASLLTVKLWPARGHERFVDAVKMGYPVFWVNLLVAWALWPRGARAAEPTAAAGP